MDEQALQELDDILTQAFSFAYGYDELNRIVYEAAAFNMFEELGMYERPMQVVVQRLLPLLVVEPAVFQACLAAVFVELKGNAQLRDWVTRHQPALLDAVSQEEFLQSQETYDPDPMKRGIGAVRMTLATPEVAALNAKGLALARRMTDGLEDLMGYKSIHDVLHDLQMRILTEFIRVSPDGITPFERMGSFRAQIQLLNLAVQKIQGQFQRRTAPPEAITLRDDVAARIKAIAGQVTAAGPEAAETAKAAAGLLRAMLRQQMSLFDSKLVEASQAIPFTAFSSLLRSLEPAGAPPGVLSAAAQGLEDIDVRLRDRRTTHRLWQRVESTLVNVEDLLRGTGQQIEMNFHCRELTQILRQISANSLDIEVLEMLALAGLGDENTPPDPERFTRAFPMFSQEARVRFQQADNRLLQDCEKLKQLQEALRDLEGDA